MNSADIFGKTFSKTLFGYRPEEVNEFLSSVASAFRELESRLARAEAEAESLRADLGQRFRREHSVADALLQAQEVAAKTKEAAESEARAIVDSAKAEAERILSVASTQADARRAEAERLASEAERKLSELRRAVAEAVSRSSAALKAGLEAIGVAEEWLEVDGV